MGATCPNKFKLQDNHRVGESLCAACGVLAAAVPVWLRMDGVRGRDCHVFCLVVGAVTVGAYTSGFRGWYT